MSKLEQDLEDFKKLNAENHRKYVQANAKAMAMEIDLIRELEKNRKLTARLAKISKEATELYGLLLGITNGEYTMEQVKKRIENFQTKSIIFIGE